MSPLHRVPLPLLAVAGGLLLALAFPPLHLLPALAGLAVLQAVAARGAGPRHRFLLGWLFGFAHYVATLWWIAIAFASGPEAFRALGVPAMLGLCAFLALGPGGLAAALGLLADRPPALRALALALGWVALEAFAAHVLRFPWNPLASTLAFSAASLQPVAWFGVRGTDLLLAFLGALAGSLLTEKDPGRRRRAWLALVPATVLTLPALLRLPASSADTGLPLRIVQPAIPQDRKWDPALRRRWLELQLDLTRRPAAVPPRLVLWPEAAVPYRMEDPRLRALLAAALPEGAVLVLGADHYVPGDPPVLHNSLYVVDARGRLLDRYDKADLVPFGEYLPLGGLPAMLGLAKLTIGAVDFSPGPGRRTLEVAGLPPFSPLICYEVAFPLAATDGRGRARLLVNLTNDAWFGRSSGPYQHLALARTRAVETGLPLLRAANTGISAVIDGYGRMRAALPLEARGVLDATVPAAAPPPPARRAPLAVFLAALALVAAIAAVDLRAASRHKEGRARGARDAGGAGSHGQDTPPHRPPCRPAAP